MCKSSPCSKPEELKKDFSDYDVIRSLLIKMNEKINIIDKMSKKHKTRLIVSLGVLLFTSLSVILVNAILNEVPNDKNYNFISNISISHKTLLLIVNAFLLIFILAILLIIVINIVPLIQKKYFINRMEYLSKDVSQMNFNNNDEFLNSIIKLSYKYLDQYYLLVNIQAKKSFILTSAVMIIGTLLLFLGILFVYRKSMEVGVLTAISGIIIEIISSIYFVLYSKSIKNLGEYHNKLVFSQNISMALKVVETIDQNDQKLKTKQKILEELMNNINHYLSNDIIKTPESSLEE